MNPQTDCSTCTHHYDQHDSGGGKCNTPGCTCRLWNGKRPTTNVRKR